MMKRMKHIILVMPVVALALTLIPSCVMIMDSGEDGRSVIYVECIQGMSDTTAITVMATAPKFGYEKSRILSDVDVTLKAGGREIPLSNAKVEVELFPLGAYYTTEKIPGGQTLEITVSGGGLDPVTATTFKPEDLKPFKVDIDKAFIYMDGSPGNGQRVIKMEITPDDPDIADQYYAVVFEERKFSSEGKVRYLYPAPILDSEGFIYSSEFGDDLVVKAGFSSWSLFKDGRANGNVVPVYMWRGASLMKDGTITVYFDGRNDTSEMRVHLMEISPEVYRYAKTLEYREDYTEALVPFVPSSYSYSNVKGGCGVFGAVSRLEGDWIELPE